MKATFAVPVLLYLAGVLQDTGEKSFTDRRNQRHWLCTENLEPTVKLRRHSRMFSTTEKVQLRKKRYLIIRGGEEIDWWANRRKSHDTQPENLRTNTAGSYSSIPFFWIFLYFCLRSQRNVSSYQFEHNPWLVYSVRNTNERLLTSSVVDPDPHSFWSAGSGSALGIRIRIQEGQNNPQKWRNYKFWRVRCSLLRDEDFSYGLDVLCGGLGLSNLQFFDQRNIKKVSFVNFSLICGHQNPGSALTKNTDPQHCLQGIALISYSSSWT